jgi:hypothetical protein
MAWIIPSSLTNRGNRRYEEFLDKCKDDAINKSIPIIDETDANYFPYIENILPIPKINEDTNKKKVNKKQYEKKSINVVEYISAMSKQQEKISSKPRKQILVTQQIRKKRKKLL